MTLIEEDGIVPDHILAATVAPVTDGSAIEPRKVALDLVVLDQVVVRKLIDSNGSGTLDAAVLDDKVAVDIDIGVLLVESQV